MTFRHFVVLVAVFGGSGSSAAIQAAQGVLNPAWPPAVQKTVATESQGTVLKGFSTELRNGQTIYEVELVRNGHWQGLWLDALGNIIEVQEDVAVATLPPAVKGGLTKAAGMGVITRVRSLVTMGTPATYEALVQQGDARITIRIGADGQTLVRPDEQNARSTGAPATRSASAPPLPPTGVRVVVTP